jgi:hypothetical protein
MEKEFRSAFLLALAVICNVPFVDYWRITPSPLFELCLLKLVT